MATVKSSKPKKQRKFYHSKPLHMKQSGLSAQLDKKLRKEIGTKSIPLRKGDTVKVVTGAKKGNTGKITAVNYRKRIVFIEKIIRKKANGEEIPLPINASNLLLVEVDRSDSRRFKGKSIKTETVKEKKTEEKDSEKEKSKIKKNEAEKAEGKVH